MEDVMLDIKDSIDIAYNMGISKDKIIIDPGIGFAKDLSQNLKVMNHLSDLCKLCFPVLLGTSRKSMIGLTLDLSTDERLEGTIATSVIGYQAGCRIFRVHDVKENYRALKIAEAIMKAG
jgi:dihydropteroate synthase